MSLLSRLFSPKTDDRAPLRPVYDRVVALAREPHWYAECGVADTLPGRFDMVTHVMALFVLRMEKEERLHRASTLLTELFVDDMDGQMRQQGVGDLVVGKKIGRLMSALGGRIGALREALPAGKGAVAEAVRRNVTLGDAGDPACIAARTIALARRLDDTPADGLVAGNLAP